jgi:hypothetical protein
MIFDTDAWLNSPAVRKFQYYDPYLTYSDPDNECFVDPKGKPGRELNPDTEALFRVGKEAFTRLTNGGAGNRDEFDLWHAGYWASLDEFREMIRELHTRGKLVPTNDKGECLPIEIKEIDDSQVVSICWQMYSASWNKAREHDEAKDIFRELFLFHVLREVDNALIGLALDGREAVVAAIGAVNALSNAIAIESGDQHLADARKQLAYEGALEKLKRDPKQRDKAFVRDCWEAWQKNPSNYKGKAAFARDMLNKCEHLESTKRIEDWCRHWEAETKE